jgi:hypothetical protein
MGCAVTATLLHAGAVKDGTLRKIRSEKLYERGCFHPSGVFATHRGPIADLASGDYRQRMIAQIQIVS